jgi:hypothetical protein
MWFGYKAVVKHLKMKIKYKRKHMNINLISGIFWLFWFFIGVLIKVETNWTDKAWLGISAMYLITYFYQRQNKYLTIAEGIIKLNIPFGKKLNLTEIKQIKKFAGDYILKTDKTELIINTKIIEPNSLVALNKEMEKLNV